MEPSGKSYSLVVKSISYKTSPLTNMLLYMYLYMHDYVKSLLAPVLASCGCRITSNALVMQVCWPFVFNTLWGDVIVCVLLPLSRLIKVFQKLLHDLHVLEPHHL